MQNKIATLNISEAAESNQAFATELTPEDLNTASGGSKGRDDKNKHDRNKNKNKNKNKLNRNNPRGS